MSKHKKNLSAKSLFFIGLGIFIVRLFIFAPLLPKETAYNLLLNLLDVSVVIFWIAAIVTAIKNHSRKTSSNAPTPTNSSSTAIRDLDDYAGTLLYMSATSAEKLRQSNTLTDDQASQLMMQIIGFCLIIFARQANDSSVPSQKTKAFMEDALRIIAQRAGTDNEEEAYKAYKTNVSELLNKYGDLPLKNDSGKQGGTLLWEYGKHMSETMGKTKDLEAVMNNVSVITSVSNAIDIKGLIDSLG